MICCEKCFEDTEIKNMIKSRLNIGNCDLCGSENVSIYNTEIDTYLTEMLEGFFDIYSSEGELTNDFPEKRLNLLKCELKYNWDIFSDKLTESHIEILIKEICKLFFEERPELLIKRVGIAEFVDENYLENNSVVGKYDWDAFIKSIKYKYRFNTDIFKKEIFKDYCNFLEKKIHRNEIMYRARVSADEKGYSNENIGAPPVGLATEGRINPSGMSYLYLSDKKQTTLYEIRAALHDYVTIGTFKLKSDIKVIDLTQIDKISVFSKIDTERQAINREHLQKISEEIARPLRRNDSKLDYLPTQYICDLIKSIRDLNDPTKSAYDGILYKSAMVKDSYNLTVFNQDLFECVGTEVHEVNILQYPNID